MTPQKGDTVKVIKDSGTPCDGMTGIIREITNQLASIQFYPYNSIISGFPLHVLEIVLPVDDNYLYP